MSYGTVRIDRCTLPGAWYEKLVGQTIELRRSTGFDREFYWAWEPHPVWHLLNIIKKGDATLL